MPLERITSNFIKVIALKNAERNQINNDDGDGNVVKNEDFNTMRSIKFAIIILQLFGYMPLNNISSREPNNLQFKWLTCKMFYVICNLICSVFILTMATIDSFRTSSSFTQQFCTKLRNISIANYFH